jgi:hypothetical protein
MDPIEEYLSKLAGNDQKKEAPYVLSERPTDLTTQKGKIEHASKQERLRRRMAAETVFGLSDPIKTLEAWPLIKTLNHPGLDHMQHTMKLKVTVKK